MSILTADPAYNIPLIKRLSRQSFSDDKELYLAQLTAAQAILEGGLQRSPPSELARRFCNLFGMKPGVIRTGTAIPGVVYLKTHEYIQDKGMVELSQPFLCNRRIEDSVEQHKSLFQILDRYSGLWDCDSFEDIAQEVYDSGYATDPNYPQELMTIYSSHNLGDIT